MPVRNPKLVQKGRSWPRRVVITSTLIAVVLLGARLAMPYVVKRLVNDRLQRIPGYTGHVNDIGIHLWRGAYSLHGLGIFRLNGKVREPFWLAKDIEFSVAWRELWHGKIVSEIYIKQGQIIFVRGPTAEESQIDLDRRWQDVVLDVFPIDITRLEITDGLLRYVDTTRQPNVNLFVTHMRATATGLRNRPGERNSGEFPAEIIIDGESLGGGRLNLVLAADPLATDPHFHVALKLDAVDLPALNESLKAYANVDVSSGTFRLVGEMAGRDGGFQGYVKPFFENVDFRNLKEKGDGLGSQVWEHIVAGAAWLVKDKARDQVATRIPFEGKFGDAKVGLFATIANLFRHGFVRAFDPTVERSVNADSVLPTGNGAKGDEGVTSEPDGNPQSGK